MTPCPPDPTLNQDTAMNSSTASAQRPRIAIIGYGSQGRAHALTLRDSGFDVTLCLRPGGPIEARAKADGFGVKAPSDAVSDAELIALLTPHMFQAQLYRAVLAPNVPPGPLLLFANSF